MKKRQFDSDSSRTFGKRRIAPRACVFEVKEHLRTFLSEALDELGFVVSGCASLIGLTKAVKAHHPDVVVFSLSSEGMHSARAMKLMAAQGFDGKVLFIGPEASPIVAGIRDLGHRLGLTMLPLLKTPFADRNLRAAVKELLPTEQPPLAPVDVREALEADWLELWYQPKVTTRNWAVDGAEALVRMRHPNWGVVPPAYFLPSPGDPNFQNLSCFIIERAIKDWRYFVNQRGPIQLAINLPMAFFRNQGAAYDLCQRLPRRGPFEGLIVEVDANEITENLPLMNELARELRFHNIGISVDGLGEQWPVLAELSNFAFAELKLCGTFVQGCADSALRQLSCRQIIGFARTNGARVVAGGVENQRDYLLLRKLGVDQVQGFLFAKPMTAQKLARFRFGA